MSVKFRTTNRILRSILLFFLVLLLHVYTTKMCKHKSTKTYTYKKLQGKQSCMNK